MRSDHYTRSKKELQKNSLKIVIGVTITSLVVFLSVQYPSTVQAAWESVLFDIFIFAGIACTIWGLWGFVIAHKKA